MVSSLPPQCMDTALKKVGKKNSKNLTITHNSSFVDPHHLDADPDAGPNSTYHPDADPEADLDFGFYLIRIRMRIRIQLFTLVRIRIRIQILATK
jgi:hypothetical protein